MSKRLFAIITDSSCDMPESYLKENDVELLNLGFFLDGETYGGEDKPLMPVKEFYDKLRAGAMPTTYQVSSETAKNAMEKILKEGRDLLAVVFSSGLSGTASSFIVAARELKAVYPERKILVVDTLAASMGEGLLLDYVIRKADSGATIEETAKYAEDIKLHIAHAFTVDNLFHLKRGGRVSAATAVVGTILHVKPVLHVDDEGHLINIGKAVGRKKSIKAVFDMMVENTTIEKDDPVFISHGDCLEDAEYLASLVKERYGADRRIMINYVGPVIGSHSGVGTLALFYMAKKR